MSGSDRIADMISSVSVTERTATAAVELSAFETNLKYGSAQLGKNKKEQQNGTMLGLCLCASACEKLLKEN